MSPYFNKGLGFVMLCPLGGASGRGQVMPDKKEVRPADLLLAIAEAAGELRDWNWDDECSGQLEKLDAAVDAWRKYLRRKKTKEKPDEA